MKLPHTRWSLETGLQPNIVHLTASGNESAQVWGFEKEILRCYKSFRNLALYCVHFHLCLLSSIYIYIYIYFSFKTSKLVSRHGQVCVQCFALAPQIVSRTRDKCIRLTRHRELAICSLNSSWAPSRLSSAGHIFAEVKSARSVVADFTGGANALLRPCGPSFPASFDIKYVYWKKKMQHSETIP
jgi:hypothetical protein